MIGSCILLHFNARSKCNIFNEISADVLNILPDIVCTIATWLSVCCDSSLFKIKGYMNFTNSRSNMTGEGSMIYVKSTHKFRPASSDISQNDAYNVYAAVVESLNYCILVIAIYRAP